MRRVRIRPEGVVGAAGVAVTGVGWGLGSLLLALVGALIVLTTLVLWVWQRECLTGVSYRRTLAQSRAMFGERIPLDIEIVNDKLLPLTWLHVEDDMPHRLTVSGGAVVVGETDLRQELEILLPMLPYQRVRRRLSVLCDHRGEHTFGPARMTSGDPVRLREHQARVDSRVDLLVYPKVFRLAPVPPASRVPLGDVRATLDLPGDPSRMAGVREYRAGDPLRHIDWRATARSSGLLVRVFEPTAAPRVAVFADVRLPRLGRMDLNRDVAEFTIAVTASLVADLVGRGIATGLYPSGGVHGHPVAHEPTGAPTALAEMLETLARISSYGPVSIADVLLGEATRLRRGASVVLVACDLSDAALVAVSEVRRRLPVTLVRVAAEGSARPDPSLVDSVREVMHRDGWTTEDVLDLAV